ncbi:hypothetical protein PHJA_002191300, partial [Phtheirospermum japonicum]
HKQSSSTFSAPSTSASSSSSLFTFVGITWYIKYDSILEGLFDQLKLLLMVSPLLLLLAVHLLSLSALIPLFVPLPVPEQEKAAGTPWGVALMLVLLLFMISYQSDLRESWFPLLS